MYQQLPVELRAWVRSKYKEAEHRMRTEGRGIVLWAPGAVVTESIGPKYEKQSQRLRWNVVGPPYDSGHNLGYG